MRLNLIPIFMSGVFLAFYSAEESIRVIIVSFLIASFYMGGGLYLFFEKSKTKIQRLASYFCFALFLMFFLRAFQVILVDSTTLLYTSNFIQLTSYISLAFISFSWVIALLLILKEQDNEIIENDNLKLQELNYSKDKFFSIISHDLRGPFNSMLGYSNLLDEKFDEYDTEKKKKFIRIINQGLQRTYKLLKIYFFGHSHKKEVLILNPKN